MKTKRGFAWCKSSRLFMAVGYRRAPSFRGVVVGLRDVEPELVDLLAQLQEILEGGGLLVRVAQKRGGVERRHHQGAVLFKELAVLARDFHIGLDDAHRRDAAEADDDFRADQRHLVAQPADAGLLLLGQRVAVLRRAAFDDVRDVDVHFAVQIDGGEHLVEQLSAAADERLALQVLVFARALADEHDLGTRISNADDHVRARLAQAAPAAVEAVFPELFEIIKHPVASMHETRILQSL